MRAFRFASLALAAIHLGCSQKPAGPEVHVDARPLKPPVEMTDDFAIPVLMYHRVSPLTPDEERSPLARDLTVSPEDFEAQVRYLKENGYELISAYDVQHALLNDLPLPKKAVAITLDDGYRDNFEHAFPILRKYGASATIFLVKNTVGGPRHLNWDQIRAMWPHDFRYGSHTVSHADLPSLDDTGLERELGESKRFLEEGLGEPVTTLAYPAGRFDDRVAERAEAAGSLTAWKKGGGPVRPGDDPFRLPRVRVHGQTDMRDFQRKVTSGIWAMRMTEQGQEIRGLWVVLTEDHVLSIGPVQLSITGRSGLLSSTTATALR